MAADRDLIEPVGIFFSVPGIHPATRVCNLDAGIQDRVSSQSLDWGANHPVTCYNHNHKIDPNT